MFDSCLEILDEIIEIYPIPGGTVDFSVPFNVRSSSVSAKLHSDSKAVNLAWLRTQAGMVVEAVSGDNAHTRTLIIENKPSVKGSPKASVAGRYYQMSVSAKTLMRTDDVMAMVSAVQEAEYFDTFIVDAAENIYLIRGCYPATQIEVTQVLPLYKETEVSISVECVNGLQILS